MHYDKIRFYDTLMKTYRYHRGLWPPRGGNTSGRTSRTIVGLLSIKARSRLLFKGPKSKMQGIRTEAKSIERFVADHVNDPLP